MVKRKSKRIALTIGIKEEHKETRKVQKTRNGTPRDHNSFVEHTRFVKCHQKKRTQVGSE